MPESSVICVPRINTTPDQARDIRARAWAFVFDCHEKKEAAPESRPEDAERRSNEIGADEASIPR